MKKIIENIINIVAFPFRMITRLFNLRIGLIGLIPTIIVCIVLCFFSSPFAGWASGASWLPFGNTSDEADTHQTNPNHKDRTNQTGNDKKPKNTPEQGKKRKNKEKYAPTASNNLNSDHPSTSEKIEKKSSIHNNQKHKKEPHSADKIKDLNTTFSSRSAAIQTPL